MQGLERWESSSTAYTHAHEQLALGEGSHGLAAYMPDLLAARRGLLVVGELPRAEDAIAALHLATALGWPVVCDILSGASEISNECPFHLALVKGLTTAGV